MTFTLLEKCLLVYLAIGFLIHSLLLFISLRAKKIAQNMYQNIGQQNLWSEEMIAQKKEEVSELVDKTTMSWQVRYICFAIWGFYFLMFMIRLPIAIKQTFFVTQNHDA